MLYRQGGRVLLLGTFFSTYGEGHVAFFEGAFFGEVFSATQGTGPTFLNPLCQLWPKYIALGQETQRFHMRLLMFLWPKYSSGPRDSEI